MGSPTFLDWLYSIEIIPKHTFRRKHKDKDLSVRARVLCSKSYSIFVVLYQRKWTVWKHKDNNSYSENNITNALDQNPVNLPMY